MIVLEPGAMETIVRFPHSDAMFARLPVAFTHEVPTTAAGCAATSVCAAIGSEPRAPRAKRTIGNQRRSTMLFISVDEPRNNRLRSRQGRRRHLEVDGNHDLVPDAHTEVGGIRNPEIGNLQREGGVHAKSAIDASDVSGTCDVSCLPV